MQIVNGGQTTASIHRARKQEKIDVSSVYVPAKITLVESEHLEEMVRHISLYANTQNVIQMADFSANDPFHIRVEQLSETIWCPGQQGKWFYERARGQYQVAQNLFGMTDAQRKRFREQTPPSRKFTKTDLAKYLVTWEQMPYQVSRGAQKNFVLFMQQDLPRRGRDWEPDDVWYRHLIAKGIVFKTAQRIAREFPAYRANIVTYLVAYLSYRTGSNLDFDMIWERQSISEQLEQLMRTWAQDISQVILDSARGRNVTEWAKKEECWQATKALDLEIPEELPPEMRTGITGSGRRYTDTVELTPQDYENITRCKDMNGETWLRIYAWGQRTGILKKWQYGIAQTLSTYAASGWVRSSTPKQAKHGVTILDLARDHGALESPRAKSSAMLNESKNPTR